MTDDANCSASCPSASPSLKAAFHLFRKVTTEILLVLSLTTPPTCQGKLNEMCTGSGSLFSSCCSYASFFNFQKYFGIFGASVAVM